MKSKNLKKGACIAIGCVLFFLLPFANNAHAQTEPFDASFNPNYILSDGQLFNFQTFTFDALKRFLASHSGTLKNYVATDIDGTAKPASDIIWRVTQTYRINPRFLIALMQKEQSLIDDPSPAQYQYDWATGYARCDGCALTDPSIQRFKGFAQQLESAAAQMRYFLDHPDESVVQKPGVPYMIDALRVTPLNHATAALYAYTPHLNGNYNLWKIWRDWFALPYPDGTVVSTAGSDDVWLIRGGERHKFTTKVAFLTRYDERTRAIVSPEEIQNYPEGSPIAHPNFSLIKSGSGDIFLVVNDEKRLIEPGAFRRIGLDPNDALPATDEELSFYTYGDPIASEAAYPLGALIQNKKSGGVYYVENGKKYALVDPLFIKLYFKNMKIKKVASKELDAYPLAGFFKLKDGALIKTPDNPTVYVVSNGTKRPIADENTFNTLGWQMKQVMTVTHKIADMYDAGEAVELPSAAMAHTSSLSSNL